MPVISHATKTHKPEKAVDPRTRQEVERCPLYPSISCDVHENMRPEGFEFRGTPATFIADPNGKILFDDEEMRKAFSAGATVKKLEEAARTIGPGLPRPAYEKILRDLEAADQDLEAERYEKALRAVRKLLGSKAVPAAMKEGRIQAKLDAIAARGAALLDEAKGKREAAPEEALALAKKVASQFKGCECAKEAADLVRAWEGK